jgi:hypothetical protein
MDAKKLRTAVEARREIAEGMFTLWNARLETLVDIGDAKSIFEHIRAPIEDRIDNCGCNVQCGAAQLERGAQVRGLAGVRETH